MKRSVKNSFLVILISLIVMSLFFWPTEESTPSLSRSHSVDTQIRSDVLSTEFSKTDNASEEDRSAIAESASLQDAIASQMKGVADVFKQQSRYPHYSIPVVDQALAQSPQAFEVTEVRTPTFDEHGDILPYTLSAATDKPAYAIGEALTIRVVVEGADDTSGIFVTAVLKPTQGQKPTTSQKTLTRLNQTPHLFQATVDTASMEISGDAQEFLALVTAKIEGKEHVTSVPFVVSQVSAELLGVENVEQTNDFLAITLDYQVHQSGYYFVKAYLDDAKSQDALLSLQTEGKMQQGSGKLVLKAHHQALKDAGSEGPYQLRIMRSFRGAAPGEQSDVPTTLNQKRFPIPDFAFDGYADIPFSDPLVERRIKAIQSLASE